MIEWKPEYYEGVGPASKWTCAIPNCGGRVDSLGLCATCHKAWRRYGMAGLERRVAKLEAGKTTKRVTKFDDRQDARQKLREAALQFKAASSESDAAYRLLDDQLLKAAIRAATAYGNSMQKAYDDMYRDRFIAEHGIEAWKKRGRDNQRRYANGRKKNGFAERNRLRPQLIAQEDGS